MKCAQLDPHEGFCRTCGRQVVELHGHLQHKRGRILGSHNQVTIERAIRIVVKPRCPDCEAQLQLMYGYWRCPWTIDGNLERFVIEAERRIIRCNWPYKNAVDRQGRAA